MVAGAAVVAGALVGAAVGAAVVVVVGTTVVVLLMSMLSSALLAAALRFWFLAVQLACAASHTTVQLSFRVCSAVSTCRDVGRLEVKMARYFNLSPLALSFR